MTDEKIVEIKQSELQELVQEEVQKQLEKKRVGQNKGDSTNAEGISRRDFLRKAGLGSLGFGALLSPVSADFLIKDDSLSVLTSSDGGSTLTEGLFVDENQNVNIPNGVLNVQGNRVATRNWSNNNLVSSINDQTGDVSLDTGSSIDEIIRHENLRNTENVLFSESTSISIPPDESRTLNVDLTGSFNEDYVTAATDVVVTVTHDRPYDQAGSINNVDLNVNVTDGPTSTKTNAGSTTYSRTEDGGDVAIVRDIQADVTGTVSAQFDGVYLDGSTLRVTKTYRIEGYLL